MKFSIIYLIALLLICDSLIYSESKSYSNGVMHIKKPKIFKLSPELCGVMKYHPIEVKFTDNQKDISDSFFTCFYRYNIENNNKIDFSYWYYCKSGITDSVVNKYLDCLYDCAPDDSVIF